MVAGRRAKPHGHAVILAAPSASTAPGWSHRSGTARPRMRLHLSALGVPRRRQYPRQNIAGEDGQRRTARSAVLFLRRGGRKSGARFLPACSVHRLTSTTPSIGTNDRRAPAEAAFSLGRAVTP